MFIVLVFGALILTTLRIEEMSLIALMVISVIIYVSDYRFLAPTENKLALFVGVALGKVARFLLGTEAKVERLKEGKLRQHLDFRLFLVALVLLLTFSSWWHFNMLSDYHGLRWMGLWNNPNDYGMIMSAGMLLTIGLLATKQTEKGKTKKSEGGILRSLRSFSAKLFGERARPGCSLARPAPNTTMADHTNRFDWFFIFDHALRERFGARARRTAAGAAVLPVILFIALFMMGIGLFFSYSRGAWLGTAVGLLYLARQYGKLKWKFVLPEILVVGVTVLLFWNATPDNSPWYVKRMDFGRPSAQHRVAAWKAGLQMMLDHPFGVGWNKTVETYEKNYHPPEDGAAAITTNDYLMLGTQLGWPGLICFVTYVALCFRVGRASRLSSEARQREREDSASASPMLADETPALRYACRAVVVAMLVEFWFDGGLFKLATASVFWILLELGSNAGGKVMNEGKNRSVVIPIAADEHGRRLQNGKTV